MGVTTAGDIMQTNVITIGPEATVRELAQLLSENNISGAPVTDADGIARYAAACAQGKDHPARFFAATCKASGERFFRKVRKSAILLARQAR